MQYSGAHTPFNESIRFALKIHAIIEKSFIMLSAKPFAIFPGMCECLAIGVNLLFPVAQQPARNIEQPRITFDNICTSDFLIGAHSGGRTAVPNENKQKIFVSRKTICDTW